MNIRFDCSIVPRAVRTLAVLLLAGGGAAPGFSAQPPGPPPHPSVGQRFVPADIDWDRPAYQTSFDDASEFRRWRLEGGKRMSIAGGKLVLESEPGKRDNHLVCWLDQEMPADFLLEFSVRPQNRAEGLNIVFFRTRGIRGESIFDAALKPRAGVFKQYHGSDLNGYHVSYWAGERTTANIRKNAGFHLVATGRIACAMRRPIRSR